MSGEISTDVPSGVLGSHVESYLYCRDFSVKTEVLFSQATRVPLVKQKDFTLITKKSLFRECKRLLGQVETICICKCNGLE